MIKKKKKKKTTKYDLSRNDIVVDLNDTIAASS